MQPLDPAAEWLLAGLRSDEAQEAWSSFLKGYSDLIYGIIRMFARDPDQAADCFLFVCTKLSEKNYRRLLAFRVDGKASFQTWLRAVVRNLCLDWHRAEFGRRQVFGSVKSRDAMDQEIFCAAFQRRETAYEIWFALTNRGFGISFAEVEERIAQLHRLLTSRQLWLLSASKASFASLDCDSEEDLPKIEVPDPSPDPETLSVMRQTHTAVARGLREMEPSDRLLLRLRYLEGLGLAEVAKVLGLKDAQTADRRIRQATDRLRQKLGITTLSVGKQKSASV